MKDAKGPPVSGVYPRTRETVITEHLSNPSLDPLSHSLGGLWGGRWQEDKQASKAHLALVYGSVPKSDPFKLPLGAPSYFPIMPISEALLRELARSRLDADWGHCHAYPQPL